MTVLVEEIAIELALRLSLGAVVGFVSGLLSTADQAERQRYCRRCGSAVASLARPDQVAASNEYRQ
jgi:hypothetical protein